MTTAAVRLVPWIARAPVWFVVVAAAVVVAPLWLIVLAQFDGNVVDLAIFGGELAPRVRPPADAHPLAGPGYDGQFFWRLATDPLLHGSEVLHTFDAEAYRVQRILYPALAWLIAAGRPSLLPVTLQLVAWAAVLGLVALLAGTAQRHGRSAWWGLPLGLMPGMYLGAVRGLADPLAATLLVAAVVAMERRRWGWAALAAAAAVLARETMMLLPIAMLAVGVAAAAQLPDRLRPAPLPRPAWVVAGVAAAAYTAWQAYAAVRIGSVPYLSTPDGQFTGPFSALVGQLDVTGRDVANGGRFLLLAIANPLYLAAIAVGAGLAVWAAARCLESVSVCAVLFAAVAVTQAYGDHWSYTRATAPLFALLAYLALTRGYRRTMTLIACGALLLPLYPP